MPTQISTSSSTLRIPPAKSIEWATPQAFFDKLDSRFGFTLDVAATKDNAKCDRYFTKEQDGLRQRWVNSDGSPAVIWCNPPYGRAIADWVRKARLAAFHDDAVVVMLVPARTDTAWFHEDVLACEYASVEFVRGRLKFGGCKDAAPFPSMLIIFDTRETP